MGLVVPDTLEVEVLTSILTPNLTMKLYGNNKTPAHGDTASAYTEIAGANYASKPLTFAHWSISSGEPSRAVYDATQSWAFNGAINAPGTIYGYFVTRDSDSKLMWAQRFPSAVVPFSPVDGSIIKVLPLFDAQSEF